MKQIIIVNKKKPNEYFEDKIKRKKNLSVSCGQKKT